jgi:hypothetical protein
MNFATIRNSGDHKAKKKKEEKRPPGKKPKHEEQDGMAQHQHCPLAKRRENRNPKYHEEQQKDVA